jgi:SAM-dependent methyltransferase
MPSATVPTANQSESDVLDVRAEVWRQRPLLRTIYNEYFAEMITHLATRQTQDLELRTQNLGLILELGGGSGNFKEYFHAHHAGRGTLIASDVVPTVHCDLAADAQQLPFPDGSLDNIVMQDVLHHIPYPLRFLAEAQRTLRPGGRIVMTEPYISPFSRLVFKLAHPEPVVMSARIFSEVGTPAGPDPSPLRGQGAFGSNQATPTLLFCRDRPQFERRFPRLIIRHRLLCSLLVYPLSGGFSGPKLLPRFAEPLARALERCLIPLAPLLAFRLLVVLQKRDSGLPGAEADSDQRPISIRL